MNPNVIAKANAGYICQECGSAKFIQAHHRIPRDDTSIIVLCAECHSKKHPDVPKALFFSHYGQRAPLQIHSEGTRKVIKLGNSLAITLPPRFVKAQKIHKGDDLPYVANYFMMKIIPMPE